MSLLFYHADSLILVCPCQLLTHVVGKASAPKASASADTKTL
jgi:hypothetical protein